jgi:4-hydroxy 2-oxovalerate aldolase/long-chain acyl-CoA synthetase
MHLLDTTLRDGSYAVDFAFSLTDTKNICRILDSCGIEYIEIGHGIGLNAGNSQYNPAIHSDEEYIIAAKEAVKTAKIGMFCIPGIARLSDLETAHNCGIDFVRVGTPVSEVKSSKEYIEKAKSLGIFVMANYMKSYTAEPSEFAEMAKLSVNYGADCIYIVDSSGGMFTRQIESYAKAVRDVSDIALGFHGHNNLGLAVSNSIYAAELGFAFIDSSLQGLGRSSGNAPTEQLAACLEKLNYNTEIDLLRLLAYGYDYLSPFVESKGQIPIDTVSGYADFHSSYMHLIHKYSAKYSIDPLELIIEVCKADKLNAADELVESAAKQLQKRGSIEHRYPFYRYHGREQG